MSERSFSCQVARAGQRHRSRQHIRAGTIPGQTHEFRPFAQQRFTNRACGADSALNGRDRDVFQLQRKNVANHNVVDCCLMAVGHLQRMSDLLAFDDQDSAINSLDGYINWNGDPDRLTHIAFGHYFARAVVGD